MVIVVLVLLVTGTGGTSLSPVNGDSVLIGGTLPDAPNISLNADGSGIFTRRTDVANSTTNQDEVVFAQHGRFEHHQRSKADGSLQIGNINGAADTANIILNADGSIKSTAPAHTTLLLILGAILTPHFMPVMNVKTRQLAC